MANITKVSWDFLKETSYVKYHTDSFNPWANPNSIDARSLSLIDPNTRVLEVGCATGYAAEWLKKEKGCKVIGLEYNYSQVKVAQSRGIQVIWGDVESQKTWRNIEEEINASGKFDVIYASAIIEHLVDPWRVLRKMHDWITPQGVLVITTSNVAHWTLRLHLLRGRWDYQAYGLLDNTHLRFFTVRTFKQALIDTGYRILHFDAETYDMPLWPSRRSLGGALRRIGGRRFKDWYLKRFVNLIAYQFVFKAAPKDQCEGGRVI